MNEEDQIKKLTAEGFDKVWVYEAEPDELDDVHEHTYDTKLVVLKGDIQITMEMAGATVNTLYKQGQEIIIPRNEPHSAKVGHEGCRYVVAEKY